MTYQVDEKDRVVEMRDFPQSSTGAPLPLVLSDEHNLFVAYIIDQPDPHWNGTFSRSVSLSTQGEHIAIVSFSLALALYFGSPNDEAFNGHPLYSRGLKPYGSYEIIDSSWIRELEVRNRVHPMHNPESFLSGPRHFVIAFHDSTFECIAYEYRVETTQGSILEVASKLVKTLKD